jgi:hypothetical protein
VKAYTLQSSEAIARWDELSPLLDQLPTTISTPLSHIRDMVSKCEAQVWVIGDPIECLLITKVENSFDERYGLMWVASGDIRVRDVLKPAAENWFREMGCEDSCVIGRLGWKKRLPDYTAEAVMMRKRL